KSLCKCSDGIEIGEVERHELELRTGHCGLDRVHCRLGFLASPASQHHLRSVVRQFKRRVKPQAKSPRVASALPWLYLKGITAPFLGTHALRHTHACRQLELGTPPKIIGDILGHRDPQSTSAYLRVASERLRELSLPVPA
ncbi:site-specific recombinase, phage integrase family protein, partial [mine drainage metagenome]